MDVMSVRFFYLNEIKIILIIVVHFVCHALKSTLFLRLKSGSKLSLMQLAYRGPEMQTGDALWMKTRRKLTPW